MKKLFIIAFTAFMLLNSIAFAKLVEVNDARLAGKIFFYERLNRKQPQAVNYSDLRVTTEYTERSNLTPVYYVFNFSVTGYIIISADDACYPVIGYSFDTRYDTENQPDNFVYWMDCRKKEISENMKMNLVADEATSNEWKRLLTSDPQGLTDTQNATTDVAPLITSLWDQGFPYNVYCPADAGCGSFGGHVTVGCVATAMSQIMYYWRWPWTGTGSHCYTPPHFSQQCADFGNSYYDWNGMTDSPNKECNPVALISYHAGVSVNMDYNTDGACSSGAMQGSVPSALKNYFRYSSACLSANKMSYSTSGWNSLLQGDLTAGEPIQYGGQGAGGGHSWVCDGFQGADYYHMNWGWSGSSNGYFYLNNLNPGGYTFNNSQSAVVHITPDPAQYPLYCTGSKPVNTYDFGSIEDGSGPTANYNDNSNCSWLIAPDDSIKTITLNFVRFNTGSDDFVKIYDGGDASAPLLATISGTPATMPSVVTTGPKMFITFISSPSGNAQGWEANYTATPAAFCSSSTTLTDGWGTISDGSGRFQYRNVSNCKWKIMPAGASKLVLTVNSFNTEQDVDKVMVYDLGTSALLATWSGQYTTMPAPVTSTTGAVMVMWASNNTVRGEGWEISYSPMVGTDEHNSLGNLLVYPNPVKDIVNLSFNVDKSQDISIRVLSVTGKVLLSKEMPGVQGSVTGSIDVSALPKGIYLLQFTSELGTTTKKIAID